VAVEIGCHAFERAGAVERLQIKWLAAAGGLSGALYAASLVLSALLVPSGMQLCGALIESHKIHSLNHVEHSQGFDLSKMNEFSTRGYFGVRLKTRPHWMLSEVKTLIDVDLYGSIPERISSVIEFEATQTGTVHGVGFWFTVKLAPGVSLTNDPDQSDGHWTQAFATFREPLAVQKGQCYPIEVTFGEHAVNIAPTEQPRLHRIAAMNGAGAREKIWNAG
jgi:type II protein arginine methyltransferase